VRQFGFQNIVAGFGDWFDAEIYVFVGYRLSDGDDDTIASIPNVMCVISHSDYRSMFSINTISSTAGVGGPPFDTDLLVIRVVRPIVSKKGTTSSIAS
jgi:hypothetical protein